MTIPKPVLNNDELLTAKYEPNTVGRDFVVGDIHGELEKFQEQLDIIKFDKEIDRMFSVGDLIDRGKESYKCLLLIKEPWFHAVRGNHEQMMVDVLIHGKSDRIWMINGGMWSVKEDLDVLRDIADLVNQLPYAITIGDGKDSIGITHAQPPTTDNWDSVTDPDSETEILWGRTRINRGYSHIIKNVGHTYHGHTPLNKVQTLGNTTFLDTGACFGDQYPLTILQIN